MPALTAALVTAAAPWAPLIGVGPAAFKVQAVATAVPPLSLTTLLRSVSVAGVSSLVTVHTALWPLPSASVLPTTAAPPSIEQL
ncbi:hypothetical protein D3C71_1941730 [compost metagenome]